MTFDECFDERTERQHRETSCAGIFQRELDHPIGEALALAALVDLGMDERDQAGACTIGGEANHLAVDRQLVAITARRVSHLDTLRHSHAWNIRTQTTDTAQNRAERTSGHAIAALRPSLGIFISVGGRQATGVIYETYLVE
jgi:hypothetical protein